MTATKPKRRKLKSLKHIKKLSTLLAFALKDLRKQERTKGCVVDMYAWWKPASPRRKRCEACLAGSVMRWSLEKPIRNAIEIFHASEILPDNYDQETSARLRALNDLRVGFVGGAAQEMNLETSVSTRSVAIYCDDRDQWWSDMKQLLADLRAAGE